LPLVPVQHHHAHLAAALAEHGIDEEALGLTWDGTGYGPDGTVWGGEALVGDAGGFARVARLRPFRLAGGERAVREPRRVALALLAQLDPGDRHGFDVARGLDLEGSKHRLLTRLIDDGIASPATSSVGRLFDGVAALVGLPGSVSFEGEAAMRLEAIAERGYAGTYPVPLVDAVAPAELAPGQRPHAPLLELDWRPMLAAILADLARGVGAATVAARFHAALADTALELARRAGSRYVALTGGCFQNRRLTVEVARRLRDEQFEVLVHRQVPANDGGIALGQVAVARRRLAESPAVAARTGG
jgi:hydrogenase maturation protein HypF